jgi:hypothetical protein
MEGKDTKQVLEFMNFFQKLREWVDDEPEGLEELAQRDESVNQICLDLYKSALWLKLAEESRYRFTAPVNPKFITAWRNFEDRFSDTINRVFFQNQGIIPTSVDFDTPSPPRHGRESGHPRLTSKERGLTEESMKRRAGINISGYKADKKFRPDMWKLADENARDSAQAIQFTIMHLYESVSEDDSRYPDDFIDEVTKALIAWHKLRHIIGFDVQSAFRRRALSPFVLIPRHVAQKYGANEHLSLYDHLSQAQDAFILGVPFAALALMRSILEVTLRDHYGARGNDISEMIDNAQKLPQACQKVALHRLRQLSNDVLHSKHSAKMSPHDLESQLLYFFRILRALIEGAPASNLSAII